MYPSTKQPSKDEPFYAWPEGVFDLIYQLNKRGLVAVVFHSEYGPTIGVTDSEHGEKVSDHDDWLSHVKGDFNADWSTAKKPAYLTDFIENCAYWWSFD